MNKAYEEMIKYGRILEDDSESLLVNEKPEWVLEFVLSMQKELLFTPIDDFFSLFPPIKRYEDDGSWTYKSTLKLRKEKFGENFGKNDLIELLMTACYENKYIQNLGVALMMSLSRMYKDKYKRNMAVDMMTLFD